MANRGELNLQKFKAYLDSLRGARQGAEFEVDYYLFRLFH